MKLLPAAIILGLVALAACACGKNGTTSTAPTEAPSVVPSPAATAAPTARPAPPVSDRTSRWGWKGLDGDFAFFSLSVRPGAIPATDRWHFDAGDLALDCVPVQRGAAWEFSDCRGLPASARFQVVINSNDDLALDLTESGIRFQQKLTRIEDKEEPVASPNVQLLWHTPLPASYNISAGLWAADGLVFAPNFIGVVDILDAATGSKLSTLNMATAPGRGPPAALEVTARNGYLYVATYSRGVLIFDVRNPAQPVRVGQFMVDAGTNSLETFTNVHTLTLGPDGKTLYAVNQSHETTDLRIIDVSNPAAPKEIGRFIRPEVTHLIDGFHDTHVIQRDGRTIVFLQSLRSGLFILDATDPKAVTVLSSIKWDGTLSHSGAAFEAGGKLYYAHDDEGFDQGMTVLDVSDLSKPRIVSRYQTRRGTSIHNIDIINGFAYVSYYVDGLRVVDLRDPASPREVAHYDTVPAQDEKALFQGAWGVKYLDGRVFISDMESGTFAFKVDLSN